MDLNEEEKKHYEAALSRLRELFNEYDPLPDRAKKLRDNIELDLVHSRQSMLSCLMTLQLVCATGFKKTRFLPKDYKFFMDEAAAFYVKKWDNIGKE